MSDALNEEIFNENLERFAIFFPKQALELETLDCTELEFCQTKQGELNLRKSVGNHYLYYHSQEGAKAEAEQWVEEVAPINIKVLFVFGLGLGYYYDVLEEWLSFDPGRFLIFIEDDLCVIRRFLETERAAKILQNTQVIVHYFQTPGERDWGRFRRTMSAYINGFCSVSSLFSALNLYKEERLTLYTLICNQMRFNMLELKFYLNDILSYADSNAKCLYENVTYLADTYRGDQLFFKFKNIPTIICGAGPSLNKQIEMLKTLENNAIIFGSGTGMNVLNRNGIIPNFGLCVDPDPTQDSRFMTNYGYEVPFFFHCRFYSGATPKIHGPRLLLTDTNGARGVNWFYQELGLNVMDDVASGISTTNACNKIAGMLLCDPIVYVGLDLAYTESKRYAEGATAHPADERKHHKGIDYKSDKTFPGPGFDGLATYTKWDWVLEASKYTMFARTHQEKHVINATEGGMKIMEVPNLPLKDVVETFMKRAYDIQNWIHAEIQQSAHQGLTNEKILNALEKWGESIGKCCEFLEGILDLLVPLRNQYLSGADVTISPLPGKVALFQTDLESEIAYQNLLFEYSGVFNWLSRLELNKLYLYPDQFDDKKKQLWLLHHTIGHYQFIKKYADKYNNLYKEVVESFKKRLEEKNENEPEGPLPEQPAIDPSDLYEFEQGKLSIKDKELGIDHSSEFKPEMFPEDRKTPEAWATHEFITVKKDVLEGQSLLFYPDGKVEGEMFYKEGKLHGPTSFYHLDGQLLARGWFLDDKRVGKSWQYYPSGKVYSLMRYKNGLQHGKQEYYFPTGVLKTIINYDMGALDGEVWLYYPNGKPKRLLNFSKGHLQGQERMWNKKGLMILEAEYTNGLPSGVTQSWHDNGRLAKKIVFHEDPQNFDLFMWNQNGTLTHKQISLPQKPFDNIIKKSNELKELLDSTTAKINDIKEKVEKKNDKAASED